MRLTKILTVALATGAMMAGSGQALAQAKRPSPPDQKQETKPVIDEKAYKAALERIPEPKEKYDPWSGARPAEPARKK
ncbi:MAG: hypothetical protein ACRCSO_06750 [Sphingomonas sp.]